MISYAAQNLSAFSLSRNEIQFLLSRPSFYLRFACARFRKRAKSLREPQNDRTPDFRIVRARLRPIVLLEAFLQIVGTSYVERFVGALQNIGKMHHIVVVYPVRYLWTLKNLNSLCE